MLIHLLFEFNLFSDPLCDGVAVAVLSALMMEEDNNVHCEVSRQALAGQWVQHKVL